MIPKNDKIAHEIFRQFEKKYMLGELAVVEAVSVASLYVNDDVPVSVMAIGPTGQFKTSLMRDLIKIFPDYVYEIDSRFTAYGLSVKVGGEKLNMKAILINDMVRTLDTLSDIKVKELASWLAELLTEGKAGSTTAQEARLEARTCLIGNIAINKFRETLEFFKSSTLSERILQFYFIKQKKDIRERTHPKLVISISVNVNLLKKSVEIPKCFRKRIWKISDILAVRQQYELQSLRPDQIVRSFLKGYALLNGRNKVRMSDIKVFESLMPNFKRLV